MNGKSDYQKAKEETLRALDDFEKRKTEGFNKLVGAGCEIEDMGDFFVACARMQEKLEKALRMLELDRAFIEAGPCAPMAFMRPDMPWSLPGLYQRDDN